MIDVYGRPLIANDKLQMAHLKVSSARFRQFKQLTVHRVLKIRFEVCRFIRLLLAVYRKRQSLTLYIATVKRFTRVN
jgi:hypothetical protein